MSTARIAFLCPDSPKAAGGIKQIYRQVDVLVAAGYDAFVVHANPHFRVQWFENRTPVQHHQNIAQFWPHIKPKTLRSRIKSLLKPDTTPKIKKTPSWEVRPSDIVVFPEVYGHRIPKMFPDNPWVIYNQNVFYGFKNWLGQEDLSSPYTAPQLKAVITASTYGERYLDFFVEKPVHRVYYGMDDTVFKPLPKKKQIAYMPRKLYEDVEQVISLMQHKSHPEWTFVAIDKMNENEVARVLGESTFFLSFNYREGFGMPPTEAMLAGCVVIGYPGQGGEEYFKPAHSFPIADRDVIALAETLDNALNDYAHNPAHYEAMGAKASAFVAQTYSMDMERSSITDVWSKILG